MKKMLLATLALTTVMQSCAPKKAETAGAYKDKVILGKFYDAVANSTFNESQLTDLPRTINLNDQTTAAKNQSDRGTCTFFATTALLESAIKIDLEKDVNLSEEFMNLVTKYSGSFNTEEGSSVSSNLSATKNYGVMLERDWGYQPSWFQKGLPCEKYESSNSAAPKECFMHNVPSEETQKNIIAFDGIEYGSVQKNTNEIIRFLAKYQRPLTVDVSVNFDGWPQTGDVFYNADLRKACLQAPDKCGGHSVLITGYDLNKKVFFFKNSWGKDWGKDGYGTMTFEMIDRYVTSPLYWAQATEKFSVPEDHAKTYFKMDDFAATASLDEVSLKAEVTGTISNISGQLVYVSSLLAKKSRLITELPGDENSTLVPLSSPESTLLGENYYKTYKYFIPQSELRMGWSAETPLVLEFPAKGRKMKTLSDLLSSSGEEAVLRTTIYVHTDDESYKILKRTYQTVD